jgi:predicted nucleotidyltransferase
MEQSTGSAGLGHVFGRVKAVLETSLLVNSVELTGSRARGDATELSDWDLRVTTSSFEDLRRQLPGLVKPLRPLGTLWDPLSTAKTFIILLDGPVKVDLLFEHPSTAKLPWRTSRETLVAIDTHFWDWTLWLGAKAMRGSDGLVADELAKMGGFILAPLGVARPPVTLKQATDDYLAARTTQEQALGLVVPKELGHQVLDALERKRIFE